MIYQVKERFSSISHFIGAAAALIGTVILVFMTYDKTDILLVCLIYGLSIIFMFTISGTYHAKKKEENENSILRKFDHLAIFFMIAGTYTPICYLYLEGTWKWAIIIAQWSLVLMGIFFKIFYLKAPRFLSTSIYLLMGWMAVIVMGKLLPEMSTKEAVYLFSGALFFTVGAIIYAIKRPNPYPDIIGFHEIFHIFILLGGLAHYLMIFHGMYSL